MSGDSHNIRERPRVLLVMGVSGAGKSSVGRKIAEQLDYRFVEGDDFHPESNREKLSKGIPLTDLDREPWLRLIREEIERTAPVGVVIACSALKESYRKILLDGLSVSSRILYLRVQENILAQRLASRKGHFVSPQILESQLRTLEEPHERQSAVIVVDGSLELQVIVQRIVLSLSKE